MSFTEVFVHLSGSYKPNLWLVVGAGPLCTYLSAFSPFSRQLSSRTLRSFSRPGRHWWELQPMGTCSYFTKACHTKKQQKRTDENVKFEKRNKWTTSNLSNTPKKQHIGHAPHLLFFLLQQGNTIRQELRIQFGLGGIPSYGLVNGDPYLTGL